MVAIALQARSVDPQQMACPVLVPTYLFWLRRETTAVACRGQYISIFGQQTESLAVVHAGPPFISLSFGLGFRAIPALGTCARQFQPAGFRFPSQIGGFAFCKNTNNPPLTLRKTASLAWR